MVKTNTPDQTAPNRWKSRKLWIAVGFMGASFALQWFGKVEPSTWQYLAGPMMAYLIGQSWVDGQRAKG